MDIDPYSIKFPEFRKITPKARRIRPLPGQCLLQVLPPKEQTESGLYLPDISHDRVRGEKTKPSEAIVIAIGPWKKARNGFAIIPDVAPGAKVIVSFYSGTKLTREIGERLRLCSVDDVLAVVEER